MQDKGEADRKLGGEHDANSPIERQHTALPAPTHENAPDSRQNSLALSVASGVSFLPADEYYCLPPQVRAVIKQYRYLSPEDMVALSDVTHRKLARDVYAQIESVQLVPAPHAKRGRGSWGKAVGPILQP